MVVYQDLANTFSALGDTTRLQIVNYLAESPATCNELALHFDSSQQAVSKHIGVLKKAGLLTQKQDGRMRICQFLKDSTFDALEWLNEITINPRTPSFEAVCFGSVIVSHQKGGMGSTSRSRYYIN